MNFPNLFWPYLSLGQGQYWPVEPWRIGSGQGYWQTDRDGAWIHVPDALYPRNPWDAPTQDELYDEELEELAQLRAERRAREARESARLAEQAQQPGWWHPDGYYNYYPGNDPFPFGPAAYPFGASQYPDYPGVEEEVETSTGG